MARRASHDDDDFVLITGSDAEEKQRVGEKPPVVAKIKQWLEPTDFNADTSEYRKHLNAHVQGTGQWVLETKQYKQWHDTDAVGDLWIRGIPGSGKSVVAANLVRHLENSENAPVLFFFFRQTIASNRSPQAFLRDACSQLLDHSPTLQTTLKGLMGKHPSIEHAPFDDLFKSFSTALSIMEKVYCVLDALDEMNLGEDVFLANLLNLGRRYPKSIKLALTSRQLPYLEAHFKGSCLVDLRLDRINVDNDIALYITHRLEKAQSCIASDEAESIKTAISTKGKGLFLYARMMMDECIRDPKRFISQALPDGLGNMYTELLSEHAARSSTSQDFQKFVLEWVIHARRPLRLTELTTIINFLPDRAGLSEINDTKQSIRSCCGPLLEVCEDEVVQIIHHSFTEFLLGADASHVTMTDTDILRFPVLDACSAHAKIAAICIKYLKSGCFKKLDIDSRCHGSRVTEERKGQWHGHCFVDSRCGSAVNKAGLELEYSFLKYARYWYTHATEAKNNIELFKLLDQFLISEDHDFECWKDYWPGFKSHIPTGLVPIHIAAHCGLDAYAELLLRRGQDVNVVDGYDRSPIIYAAMEGHASIVAALLRHNAQYETFDAAGLNALHHAAKCGHAEVMQILLDAGADPLAGRSRDEPRHPQAYGAVSHYTEKGQNALYFVCTAGHVAALEVLLHHYPAEELGQQALFWAVEAGRSDILEVLLRRPVDVNVLDFDRNTLLFYAAQQRVPLLVKHLLYAGADPNLPCAGAYRNLRRQTKTFKSKPAAYRREIKRSFAPLHGWAGLHCDYGNNNSSERDIFEVLGLLLNAGADINARTHAGKTVLHGWGLLSTYAASYDEAVVDHLLEYGADATVVDDEGNSVLHSMTGESRQYAAVAKLVKAGADINHQSGLTGRTPLIQATLRQRTIDLDMFNDLNASFNIQDRDGNTAFHYACSSWSLEAHGIDKWLQYSDPTIRNRAGIMAAAYLCWGNGGQARVDGISKMVEKGLDIESRDHQGRTLLLSFLDNESVHGAQHFVRELLLLGANANARDYEGKSALHLLAACDLSWIDGASADIELKYELMKELVDAGCELNPKDLAGNNIIQAAIHSGLFWGKLHCALRAIVQLGSDVSTANFQGRTALHNAAAVLDDTFSGTKTDSEASLLQFVLQLGHKFDINAQDNWGTTAFHLAAETSEINVWLLVQAGADIGIIDNSGCNALHYAARNGKCNVLDLLISLYEERSYSIDTQDFRGRSPLHEAVRSGKLESVISLMKAGANPVLLDGRKRSMLHAVAEYDLLTAGRRAQKGRDKEALNGRLSRNLHLTEPSYVKDPISSLNLIIDEEQQATQIRQIVKVLLEAGVDLVGLDDGLHTAYDVALMLGNQAVTHELAPLIAVIGEGGLLPLDPIAAVMDLSARSNLSSSLEQLDPDCDWKYVMERVFSSGDVTAVKILRERHIPLVNEDGSSALHFAVRWGMVSMVESLCLSADEINACVPPLLLTAAKRSETNIAMLKCLLYTGADVNFAFIEKRAHTNDLDSITIAQLLSTGHHYWYSRALSLVIDVGADIEAENHDGSSCLHIALSRHGQVFLPTEAVNGFWADDTLEVLLEHDAMVNKVSSKGLTPLNVSLHSGRGRHPIEKLLEYGADGASGPMPALASAIDSADLETVMLFLEMGANPNVQYTALTKKRYEDELVVETPLFNAAATPPRWAAGALNSAVARSEIQSTIVDLLLEYGANPLQEMNKGTSTVLHEIAARNGLLTKRLLEGIDLETRDSEGRTALHRACQLRGSYKRTLEDEHAALVLIDNDVDVHAQDDAGNTPLYYSTLANLEKTSTALVSKGASARIKNKNGQSPMHAACVKAVNHGYISFKRWAVELLLSAGADPLERTLDGKSILHHLAPELMRLSSKDGADKKSQYDEKKNPAELAALKQLYQRLRSLGCDPEAQDKAGNTPIFDYVAAIKIYSEVSVNHPPDEKDQREMFCSHDIFKVNDKGEGLLHVVAQRQESCDGDGKDGVRLFELLVSLGLDPRKEDGRGWSALDVAAACDNHLILDLYARKD